MLKSLTHETNKMHIKQVQLKDLVDSVDRMCEFDSSVFRSLLSKFEYDKRANLERIRDSKERYYTGEGDPSLVIGEQIVRKGALSTKKKNPNHLLHHKK